VNVFKVATKDPEFLEIMKNIYTPAIYKSPEECRKLVEEAYKDHGKIITDLGIHKSQTKPK
jgi:tripartite-type tricarboxylate transporter receptor subunit TctC